MESDRAELSSIASQIGDLTARVVTVAKRHQGTPREDLSNDLYEVERSLRTALRRLERTARAL